MARSRISGSQLVDADVLSEEEHDVWVHKNLVCSGTLTFTADTPTMVSGSGDIYCDNLYAENIISTSCYTGSVPIVTSIESDGTVNNSYLIFNNGILTTVSGAAQSSIDIPGSLLSIL